MYKVMKSLRCENPLIGTVRTSVDNGVNANLESVDKFCCLGDMLNVDWDADAALETRIRIGWNKFRQLLVIIAYQCITCEREIVQQLYAK